MAKWLKERLPKNREELLDFLRTQLQGLFWALVFNAAVLAILYLCGTLLGDWKFLNEWMKGEVAIDMLMTTINVDAALIGFTGVIAVYGLREISRTIERAQRRPRLTSKDKDKLEAWQTNFLWSLLLTVIVFAASILFSLQSMSYATVCGLVDNVAKCFIFDLQSSSRFLWPCTPCS